MREVNDKKLNLTVMFNASSNLPHIIHSYQSHPIYGPSTYDLQIPNYTRVNGVMFLQRFQWIYDNPLGSDAVLKDVLVEHIDINPTFGPSFFAGLAAKDSESPQAAPKANSEISHSDVLEGFTNMVWSSDQLDLGNLSAIYPLKDVLKLWNLNYENINYAQLVMEFGDDVIVADEPEKQTDAVIEWIQQNIAKPITHVWVSRLMMQLQLLPNMLTTPYQPIHRHRDHSGEAAKYVKLGAKLIIPEMAISYWSGIPGAQLVTFA